MLDELMINMGYSIDQIHMILNSYPISNSSESTLLYNFKNLTNYFHRNGLSNEDIIYITTVSPNIIVSSIENIKTRVSELDSIGFNKLECFKMIKNYPYIIDISFQKIINKFKYLEKIGFNTNNIYDVFVIKTNILSIDNSSLKKRFNFFLDLGFNNINIINIIGKNPNILDLSTTTISKIINEFKKFGFKDKDIISIITKLPSFLTSNVDINDVINKLMMLGFNEEEIISIINKVPMLLLNPYFEKLEGIFTLFNSFTFSNIEIIKLCVTNPYILIYSNDMIRDNFNNLTNFGYSVDTVKEMIINMPLLIGYDKGSLLSKLEFYKENKLDEFIGNNSHLLSFSLDFIKARYSIITDNNIEGEYYKDLFDNNASFDLLVNNLFLNEEQFYRKFQIHTDDLMKG